MKIQLLFFSAAMFLAAATSKTAEASQQRKIFKIGAICPIEGRYAPLGESFLRGASIALKEERLSKSDSVELIVADSRGLPLLSRSLAERLIREEHVDALLGDVLSSPTIAAAQFAQQARTVMVSPVATEEGIGEIGEWVFQLAYSREIEIAAIARMACDDLSLRRFAFLSADEPASRKMASLFAAEVERLGGFLVKALFYPPGTTDFAEFIDSIKESAPEALFIGSETDDLVLILPQLSYHEFGVQILGTSSWSSRRLLRMVGKDLEGAIFPVDVEFRNAERDFAKACDLVGEPAGDTNQVVVGSYRGTKLLLQALKRSSSGGEPLREELSNMLERRLHPYLELVYGEGIPFYKVRGERAIEWKVLRLQR